MLRKPLDGREDLQAYYNTLFCDWSNLHWMHWSHLNVWITWLSVKYHLWIGTHKTTHTLVQIESPWTKKETSHDCWFLIMKEHISLLGHKIPIEAQIFARAKQDFSKQSSKMPASGLSLKVWLNRYRWSAGKPASGYIWWFRWLECNANFCANRT